MITAFGQSKQFAGKVKQAGGKLYLDARKATGYTLGTNSPLTNPWNDLLQLNRSYALSNLLGADGNFGSGGANYATGWSGSNNASASYTGNIQTFKVSAQYGNLQHNATPANGSYYYFCAYVSTSSLNTYASISGGSFTSANSSNHSGGGTFEFLSVRTTATGTTVGSPKIVDGNTSAWVDIQVKQAHFINLTSIFGAGNEPSKQTMDWLMKDLINENTYIGSTAVTVSDNTYRIANNLGTDGNFGSDSNSDGLADGWTSGSVTSLSVSNNIQKFTPTVSGGNIAHNIANPTVGNVYYACAYIKSSVNTNRIRIKDNLNTVFYTTISNGTGQFEFVSVSGALTTTVASWKVWVDSGLSSGWGEIEVKQYHTFDLTQIFGAGNEPPKAYMDTLMQSLISANGYINTRKQNLGNNALATNFAGTTSSGIDNSNPLKPFWRTDGTDDYFSMLNTNTLDIVNAPLAIFATVNLANLTQSTYIVGKNLSTTTDYQFGIVTTNVPNVSMRLEGAERTTTETSAMLANTWYNVGFIWDGTNVKAYINGVQSGTTGTYSGTLTSRAKLNIARRETGAYFNGGIATVTIYSGSQCTESNVLAAEKAISKAYIS